MRSVITKYLKNPVRYYNDIDDCMRSYLDQTIDAYIDYEIDIVDGELVEPEFLCKDECYESIKNNWNLTKDEYNLSHPIINTKDMFDLSTGKPFKLMKLVKNVFKSNNHVDKIVVNFEIVDYKKTYMSHWGDEASDIQYFGFCPKSTLNNYELIYYILTIGTQEQKDYINDKIHQYCNCDFDVNCCIRNDELTELVQVYLADDWQKKIDNIIINVVDFRVID